MRIGRFGRRQSAPLSAPGCSSRLWSCTAAGFAIAGYPLCWALWYGNASRPFSCCGDGVAFGEIKVLRAFVLAAASCENRGQTSGRRLDQGPIVLTSSAPWGDGAIGRSWRAGNRSADALTGVFRKCLAARISSSGLVSRPLGFALANQPATEAPTSRSPGKVRFFEPRSRR
jgi:hypothetical protein